MELVKIVKNAFFVLIPYRYPWIMWKLCTCWAISITICTSNHVQDKYLRSTRSSKNLKKQQLFASLNIFSLNVYWSKKVSKISKNQFQPTNEASFRVVWGIVVRFKHMIRGLE